LLGVFLWPSFALGCADDQLRVGASADLPDCRAYELVTPADANGAAPITASGGAEDPAGLAGSFEGFSSSPASASGDGFLFGILGTTLPGTDGGGFVNTYRAIRGTLGWASALIGPEGRQATVAAPGGFSADHGFQAFVVRNFVNRSTGPLDLGDPRGTGYVRYPDGSFRLAGEGSIPADPDNDGNPNGYADELRPSVRWISPGGEHIIFSQPFTPVRLLPDAPPDGVPAVYDRTGEGLRVASLLPGEVVPTGPSRFEGASADGSTILFRTSDGLFARIAATRTIPVASGEVLAAGTSTDGRRTFYVEGSEGTGNLFRFEPESGARTQINTSGDARFVNVAADGSHVYFESPSALDQDGHALPESDGAPHLYVWNGSYTEFIAPLSQADLARKRIVRGELGLAQWVQPPGDEAPARNGGFLSETSRTNSSGTSFAFESSADPLGESPAGNIEIYRYLAGGGNLVCISCRESGSATSDATFADYSSESVSPTAEIPNLSEDGKTIFFQTAASLTAGDSNGRQDVYEWHEGYLFLISTGRDWEATLLMGATPSGKDVFIRTAERLVPGGQEPGVPAVYDARVNGGFAPPPAHLPCSLESCQIDPAAAEAPPPPGSALFAGPPNPRRHRGATPRCRKKHRHHQHRCGGKHPQRSHSEQARPR
jgi:hypothetical protein